MTSVSIDFSDWRVILSIILLAALLTYVIWPAPCQRVDGKPCPKFTLPGLPDLLGWFFEPKT